MQIYSYNRNRVLTTIWQTIQYKLTQCKQVTLLYLWCVWQHGGHVFLIYWFLFYKLYTTEINQWGVGWTTEIVVYKQCLKKECLNGAETEQRNITWWLTDSKLLTHPRHLWHQIQIWNLTHLLPLHNCIFDLCLSLPVHCVKVSYGCMDMLF